MDLFRILSGILHTGNVVIEKEDRFVEKCHIAVSNNEYAYLFHYFDETLTCLLLVIMLLGFCTNPVRWRKRPQDQALVSFALVSAYVSSFLHDCFNVFFVVVGCRSSVLSISAR